MSEGTREPLHGHGVYVGDVESVLAQLLAENPQGTAKVIEGLLLATPPARSTEGRCNAWYGTLDAAISAACDALGEKDRYVLGT